MDDALRAAAQTAALRAQRRAQRRLADVIAAADSPDDPNTDADARALLTLIANAHLHARQQR